MGISTRDDARVNIHLRVCDRRRCDDARGDDYPIAHCGVKELESCAWLWLVLAQQKPSMQCPRNMCLGAQCLCLFVPTLVFASCAISVPRIRILSS